MSKEQQDITAAQILQFAEDYCQKLDEVKRDQPYHLNIIEELHINENAHSRILAKLLQYNDKERKYVFLESLLKDINKKKKVFKCDFSKINVVSPEITQEKDRIDVLILDNDNAIIIENKICGAKDQEKQLSRYIDRIQKKGYKKADIYIVYLTKYYQSPSSDTWSSKREERNFSARFLNLSYIYDILSWLKKELDILPCKEIELRSALEQYVNYLEILKKGDEMDKNMKDFFKEKYENDLKTLIVEQNKVQKFNDEFINFIRERLKEEIKNWIPKNEQNHNVTKKDVDILVKDLKINNQDYWLYIRLNDTYETLSCCLEKQKRDIKLKSSRIAKIKEIRGFLNEHEDYILYKDFDVEDIEAAKNTFMKIIEIAKSKI